MLIFDFITIGNKLYTLRKKMGMTQLEVSVAADVILTEKNPLRMKE